MSKFVKIQASENSSYSAVFVKDMILNIDQIVCIKKGADSTYSVATSSSMGYNNQGIIAVDAKNAQILFQAMGVSL